MANFVIEQGRLTRDPEIAYRNGQNGQQFCTAKGTLAVDGRRSSNQGENQAYFIPFEAVGSVAEIIEKYCKKGTKILIQGYIETFSYTNKNNETRYGWQVHVNNMEFSESKKAQEGQGTPGNGGNGYPQGTSNNGGQNGAPNNRGNSYPQGAPNNGAGGYPQGAPGNGYPQNGGYNQQNVQNGGYPQQTDQGAYGNGFMNIPDNLPEELPFN